jgi:hypothetical protein
MPSLPLNNMALNRAALKWLKEAQAPAPSKYLHLLNLAQAGMSMQSAMKAEWPQVDRTWLKEQLDALFGWKAANVLAWLFSNPKGGNKQQQEAKLYELLKKAQDAKQASSHVLNAIYRKQTSVPESKAKPQKNQSSQSAKMNSRKHQRSIPPSPAPSTT